MRPSPPACVAFVARTHWVVGGVITVSIGLLHWLMRDLPRVEVGVRAYQVTGGLAALYLITGALVWFGAPLGPSFSRVCSLLYLPRPRFGFRIWEIMNSAEFRAHFQRRATKESPTSQGR